ncbi:MAG: glutathione S-transferase [Myxococcales bacterium]|nr:glutathione S-transferase [Myxococcales bacterium]
MPTVLHQLPPYDFLPSLSPFCLKVHVALRLKGMAFTTRDTLFAKTVNPRGKLPYLVLDGEGHEDSSHILRVLDAKVRDGPKLFPGGGDVELLEDWADESLYWFGVYAKFEDPEGWQRLAPHFRRMFPAPLRLLGPTVGRRQTRAKLKAHGLTTRAPALVKAEFERHLDALEQRLDGRRFLTGDALTAADVGVSAMLAQLHPRVAPWWAARLDERKRLKALVEDVMRAAGVGVSAA